MQQRSHLSRRQLLFAGAALGVCGWIDGAAPRRAAAERVDPKLQEEMRKLYALDRDQDIKVVLPPFPPSRLAFYAATYPDQAQAIPAGPDAMYLRWEGDKLQIWGMTFGGGTDFPTLMRMAADIFPQEIEGDAELLKSHLAGDFAYRLGAKPEPLVRQVSRILREQFKLPAQAAFREVERKVYVARGQYAFKPLPDRERIEVYEKELGEPNVGGGGSGTFGECLQWIGMYIQKRVVNEVQNAPEKDLSWHYNEPRKNAEDRDAETVLRHITEQTGITFKEETRKVRVLFLDRV
jgi:hypothetical protein